MKYEEIERTVAFYEKEIIHMPNELFDELRSNINNSQQLAFAYSYLYLTTYLYRHCKYYNVGGLDNDKIKEILGYSSNTRSINPLIKKGGLLDQLQMTSTVKDFPLSWTYDSLTKNLEFMMFSELDGEDDEETIQNVKKSLGRKYSIKLPVRAFYRYPHIEECKEAYEDGDEDGTFFEVENTHQIPFEVFMFCMANDKIGTIGFYIYSYIKMMNNFYKGGYDCPVEKLAKETGIATRTLTNYLDELKKYNMIQCLVNQKHFVLGLPDEERKANTYIVNEFDSFSDIPQAYEKIKIKTRAEYYAEQREKYKHLWGKECDIPLEDLPY
ncbi:hypothetical protein J7E38_14155 [Bacillus sp. ISL-35]|uniref:hypothetical protein n=1 Tax=Bacillus sp. ISL-35 TaxID=2819122 RepID=UPI001BEA0D56|nr:hypothetical protein [Bacillus sp. ISL-35]MBT2680154.1 hypothetical protein [Bacillus sp. ISL-35]MBT2704428.1 hypothetical protein [Chryseobacterium sp. ISL-80]